MGYWWPPSLYAYDPSVRELDWTLEDTGKGWNALVPGEYDLELIKCWAPSFMPTVKGKGGFDVYQQMIALRTPDDPPKGGLKPDSVNPDGSITIEYFDFSDSSKVKRKRVTWRGNPKTGEAEIANRGGVPEEWIGNNGVGSWQQEGPDAEREIGKAAVGILTAIGTIASAVLSVTGVGGALFGAAFSAMWGFMLGTLKRGGRPPTADDVLSFAGAMGRAVGPGLWGIVSKNEDLQNLMKDGFISKMAKLPGNYADKIAGAVNDLGSVLPRLPLANVIPGFDSSAWAKGALKGTQGVLQNVVMGSKNEPIALSELTGAKHDAFAPALRAFLEPEPKNRALIRRNFLWCDVSNSSAITHGNPMGPGAHNEQEQDIGLLGASSYFDQYLAMLNASLFAEVEARTQFSNILQGSMEESRRKDPAAKKALYDLIGDLRDRYRMV